MRRGRFNPKQKRDYHGRWTSGGGSAKSKARPKRKKALSDKTVARRAKRTVLINMGSERIGGQVGGALGGLAGGAAAASAGPVALAVGRYVGSAGGQRVGAVGGNKIGVALTQRTRAGVSAAQYQSYSPAHKRIHEANVTKMVKGFKYYDHAATAVSVYKMVYGASGVLRNLDTPAPSRAPGQPRVRTQATRTSTNRPPSAEHRGRPTGPYVHPTSVAAERARRAARAR